MAFILHFAPFLKPFVTQKGIVAFQASLNLKDGLKVFTGILVTQGADVNVFSLGTEAYGAVRVAAALAAGNTNPGFRHIFQKLPKGFAIGYRIDKIFKASVPHVLVQNLCGGFHLHFYDAVFTIQAAVADIFRIHQFLLIMAEAVVIAIV